MPSILHEKLNSGKTVKLTLRPKLSTFKKAKNVLPLKSFKKGNELKNLETH